MEMECLEKDYSLFGIFSGEWILNITAVYRSFLDSCEPITVKAAKGSNQMNEKHFFS